MPKSVVHYGLGATWGTLYQALRRSSGMRPVGAGLATGALLSLLVDEALSPGLGITPPSKAYPKSAHVRGFLTHLVYGRER